MSHVKGRSRWLRLKKGLAASAALSLGLLGVGVAAATSASAHTPRVSATCEVLTVDLSNYAASQPGRDAVDPVTKTVYQRYSWNPKQGHHNEDGTPDKTGSTPLNDPEHWQANTSNYNGSDPVGEVFQRGNGQNSSWFFWTSKEEVVTPGQDAVAPKTNHVTVIIDGATVADTDFSKSWNDNFSFADKTVAHNWTVKVKAYDDQNGAKGWTFTKSGTTTPCAPPPTPKDASASINVAPATCDAPGSVSWGNLVNAVATDLNQSVGTHVATSPAVDGHLFADGNSVWEQSYTIEPQKSGSECAPPPVDKDALVVTQTQCAAADAADGTATVTVTDTRAAGSPARTYSVLVDGKPDTSSQWFWELAGGESHTFQLAGLTAGTHTVRVNLEGNVLYASDDLVIENCDVTPPPTPENPTATAVCDHCANPGAADGSATVTVTNTADDTKASATYEVTLNGVTKTVKLDDGKSGTVTFDGLAAGKYDVKVKGDDGTKVKTSVTIDECEVVPPQPTEFTVTFGEQVCVAGSNNDTVGDATVTPVDAASVDTGKWVKGERVVIVTPNEGFVPADGVVLTRTYADDGSACGTTPPATPEPTTVTTHGDWQGGEPTCDNPEVEQTRETWSVTTTYEWVWSSDKAEYTLVSHVGDPVKGEPESRTVKYEGDDCTVTPPVVNPPTDQSNHTPPTKVQTDSDTSSLFLILGGLLALALTAGAGSVVVAARRR